MYLFVTENLQRRPKWWSNIPDWLYQNEQHVDAHISPEALHWSSDQWLWSECNYLEVSHHDETGGADPGGGEAGRVEDAVLMLLYHVGVAQQANQHHWRMRREEEEEDDDDAWLHQHWPIIIFL